VSGQRGWEQGSVQKPAAIDRLLQLSIRTDYRANNRASGSQEKKKSDKMCVCNVPGWAILGETRARSVISAKNEPPKNTAFLIRLHPRFNQSANTEHYE